MKIEFVTPLTWKQRLAILWRGAVYVSADYAGSKHPLDVRLSAVTIKEDGSVSKY